MSRTEAVPVPPAAAFTLIVTALAAVLVVTMELPAFIRKLWLARPSVFARIVTGSAPAFTTPFSVTAFGELNRIGRTTPCRTIA